MSKPMDWLFQHAGSIGVVIGLATTALTLLNSFFGVAEKTGKYTVTLVKHIADRKSQKRQMEINRRVALSRLHFIRQQQAAEAERKRNFDPSMG